jgi:hypothetical protein
MMDFDFPNDDYFDAFAEAGLSPTGRFRHPPHKVALSRGWSELVGNSANGLVPRGGAPWTAAEERDLMAAAARCTDLSLLASAHGRTEIAITCRLEQLGYDRGALATMDFADIELRVLAQLVGPTTKQQGVKKMKMTANRMMAMLAIYRGTYENELKVGTSGPDLAHLTAEGLVSVLGQRVELTAEGRNLVEAMLGRTSSSRSGATTAWDAKRDTSVLDDQRFFLVASGDCHKAGGGPTHDRPTLKSPPRVVQSSGRDATREADRLARDNPGSKFFVLQATSVHQVPAPQPTFKQL